MNKAVARVLLLLVVGSSPFWAAILAVHWLAYRLFVLDRDILAPDLVAGAFLAALDVAVGWILWAVYREVTVRIDSRGIHKRSFRGRWQTLSWDSISVVIDCTYGYTPGALAAFIVFRTEDAGSWRVFPPLLGDFEAVHTDVLKYLPTDVPINEPFGREPPLETKRQAQLSENQVDQ